MQFPDESVEQRILDSLTVLVELGYQEEMIVIAWMPGLRWCKQWIYQIGSTSMYTVSDEPLLKQGDAS